MILCPVCGYDFQDPGQPDYLVCPCRESVLHFSERRGTELHFGAEDLRGGYYVLHVAYGRRGDLRGDFAAGPFGRRSHDEMEALFRRVLNEAVVGKVMRS